MAGELKETTLVNVLSGVDALLPNEIAARAEEAGVIKARRDILTLLVLAVLAGAFIGLGALFSTTVTAGAAGDIPFGIVRLLGGLSFSLGLILVIVAGAELFTGDTLMVMARASGKLSTGVMLRAWVIIYLGNFIGAAATALMLVLSGQYGFGDGAVGLNALVIAEAKAALPAFQALMLGVLCNVLVCLTVWMCLGARQVMSKILAIIFPITAFVAAGFEHSVANMYFLPVGLFIKMLAPAGFWESIGRTADDFPALTWEGFVMNLAPVTVGNIIGGALMVGAVYWFIYLRRGPGHGKA